MAERNIKNELPQEVCRLREEHKKVVSGCERQIQHWRRVEEEYKVLQERLRTLPDRLSYDIMVPFGSLAFMPGKLVHTNEVTVLLGDNWFARCSAKQAVELVEHRKTHVKIALDDLCKVVKSFEDRVGFTEDLEKLSGVKGDYVDIREEVESEDIIVKGKKRLAHKPHSKPKVEDVVGGDGGWRGEFSEEELWSRLDKLEAEEEKMDVQDRMSDGTDRNDEDTTSSSSEEEKDADGGGMSNGLHKGECWPAATDSGGCLPARGSGGGEERDEEEEEDSCVPTIFFSHTVEPKKVRINTGKNTMLKFSERKEEAKRKKKNGGGGSNGHELARIKTPADIYRVFVDVVNGELVPRKSILKSRSRENSVCSDTSESSAADFEERRVIGRSLSHDEATHSDTSEGSPPVRLLQPLGLFEAFSGTVVEKDPGLTSSIPHLTIAPPALPTILERKSEEVVPEAPAEAPKRVSKFKAARLQQK